MSEKFELLGINPYKCSPEEVMTAYREKTKILHPDKGGNSDTFMELKKLYTEALRISKDILESNQSTQSTQSTQSVQIEQPNHTAQTIQSASIQEAISKQIIGNPLNTVDTYIMTLDNVYHGAFIPYILKRKILCQGCNSIYCNVCNTFGYVTNCFPTQNGQYGVSVIQCSGCNGRGFVTLTHNMDDECKVCHGLAYDIETEECELQIPPGTKDGYVIHFSGWGRKISPLQYGDLDVVCKMETSNDYIIRNLDIIFNIKISLMESILGTSVKIPIPRAIDAIFKYDGPIDPRLEYLVSEKFGLKEICGDGSIIEGKIYVKFDIDYTINNEFKAMILKYNNEACKE
jgi:DnaJ-class molecular chaperone